MKRIQRLNSQLLWTTRKSCFGLTSVLLCMATGIFALPVQAQECEPHWSDEFPSGELNQWVLSIAEFDDGSGQGSEIYISGFFTQGSGQTLNHIARLDRSNKGWAPLGDGVDGNIWKMAVFDDGHGGGEALFAAGYFDAIDGITANNIAKWNGTTWSPLGEGLKSSARSIYIHDDGSGMALYAGGTFTAAGGIAAERIARWDGKTWTPLGSGVNGIVRALVEFDDGSGLSLYAGGGFTTAGGKPANNIAKWDGENWSPLGDGINLGVVYSLGVFDDGSGAALYVGGVFEEAGGAAANNIAKWDGESWSTLGTGADGAVVSLAAFDDGFGSVLYVGGSYDNAGSITAKGLAKWDGKQWMAMHPELFTYRTIYALTVVDDPQQNGQILCMGGFIPYANWVPFSNFVQWDGTNWVGAGNGLLGAYSRALAIVEKGGDVLPGVYAGGWLDGAGTIASHEVSHWNGEEWAQVGEANNSPIGIYDIKYFDMETGSGPSLYVAGGFGALGGQDAHSIAKWDGTEWSPLGTGLASIVWCLESTEDFDNYGPALFAGGWFTQVGETTFNYIARWDGSEWYPLGAGLNNRVRTITIFDDGLGDGPALYAGGEFTAAGKVNANHIAKWDGLQWSPLGEGMDGLVSTLAVYDDGSGSGPALYAGGYFTSAGGTEVQSIARWDGKQWSAIGDWKYKALPAIGVLKVLDDGITSNPALYVGGRFESFGGIDANNIARWDGQSWSTLGTGFEGAASAYEDPMVLGLEIFDDGLSDGPSIFATGLFDFAGGHSSLNFAKWTICNIQILGDLNGDGVVNTSDLLILFANWGPCDDCNNCLADLDDNCVVGTSDLLILFSNWG